MAEKNDVCSSSPVRTPKLQLTAEQPSTGECWVHQKEIPHVQGQRRSPSKTVGGVKSHLESNHIPARDARWTPTKPCTHQDTETPQRLSQTCVWVFSEVRVSSGLLQGQGLWVQLPGHTAWGISPLGVSINPTIELPSRGPTNCRTIIPKKFSHY